VCEQLAQSCYLAVDWPIFELLDRNAVPLSWHSTTPTPTSSPTSPPVSSRECRRVVQLATGITSRNHACRTCRRGCPCRCRCWRSGMSALRHTGHSSNCSRCFMTACHKSSDNNPTRPFNYSSCCSLYNSPPPAYQKRRCF